MRDLLLIAMFTAGCTAGTEPAPLDDWRETSFTDERGLQWQVAVSLVDSDVQGWAGVTNVGDAPILIEGVRNCAFANPVDLRSADGELVDIDPFLGGGNFDVIDDSRCAESLVALPVGETLWTSTVLWEDVEDGTYEVFGTFWNGNAAVLRFAL